MSMLDVFFSKGAFRGAKCKTLLNLTIPRIKLLRNRREIHLKQMKRDIAKLLEGGQEATARIRVEHIIREENTMAAQEILELFCELIVVRLPIIEAQRECPLDLKEAISSLCFAAPRCADLPELQQVQMLFAAKYGKEFVAAATELMPDCGVNRQIIELLSVRAPSAEVKVKLLKEIAAEHEVEWDPAASETEFLKPHEDLLNGPTYLVAHATTGSSIEENDAPLTPVEASDEHPGSDCETSLDLPEVPRASVRPNTSTAFSPDLGPVILPPDVGSEIEGRNSGTAEETPNLDIETKVGSKAVGVVSDHPALSVSAGGSQQFVPFVASPPSSATFPASQSERLPAFDPSPSVLAGTSPSPTISAARNEKVPSVPESDASLSRSRSGVDVDLQDVLAAAQVAAETAERAAAAARSAASLAQVRITELTMKNRKLFEQGTEDPASDNNDSRQTKQVKDSFLGEEKKLNHFGDGEPTLPTAPSPDVPSTEDKSPSYVGHGSAYQPQRSTSLEDDPYYSYPNLFSRQNSTIPSPTGDSPSPH